MKIRINELLKERNMTMYALADKSGIPYSTIRRATVTNVSRVRFDTLEKICKTLNCGIEELLEIEYDDKGE